MPAPPAQSAMPEHFIDADLFRSRLQLCVDNWSTYGGDAAGAFEICLGKGDDSKMPKSSAMSNFLFGLEFTETLIIITKEGEAHILTSAKKIAILEQVKGQGIHVYAREADNTAVFGKLFEMINSKGGSLGSNTKEKLAGKFAEQWKPALEQSGINLVDFGSFFSQILMPKDAKEVALIKKSANFTIAMMRKGFIEKIEDVIEEEKKVSHTKICGSLDRFLDDEEVMNAWGKQYSFDPAWVDLEFTQLQSGQQFDLRPGIPPNKENLDQSCVVAALSSKVREYRTGIARTFIVDATAEQKEIYRHVLAAMEFLVGQIKPGATLGELHGKTLDFLETSCKDANVNIGESAVKNFGHVLGLEWKDSNGVIKPGNTTTILPGMALFVSIGLTNLTTKRKGKKTNYALWVADTVQAPLVGDAAVVLTDSIAKSDNEVFYCLDDDVDEQEADDIRQKAAEVKQQKQRAGASAANAINAENIVVGTRSSRRRAVQDNTDEIARVNRLQNQLRQDKVTELAERFADKDEDDTLDARAAEIRAQKHLDNCRAYSSPAAYPEGIPQKRCFVDNRAECLLVFIQGKLVPFHIKTIKNVAQSPDDGGISSLRVNFNTPGSGLTQDLFPKLENEKSMFIKEFNIRGPKNSLTAVMNQVKDLQKRVKQKEEAALISQDLTEQPDLILFPRDTKNKAILRDCDMKPNLNRGKTRGILQAHKNGWRFVSQKGDRCDIIYSNVKHAIFQPMDPSDNMAIVHFHLRDGIMVGKKKWDDVQFHTMLGMEHEDLGKTSSNRYDPDGLQEEEQMRQQKNKINEIFKGFVTRSEQLSGLTFDMPYREIGFQGVPNRTTEWVFPGRNCLMALTDWPAFCMGLDDIELVSLERCNYGVRNFDIVFLSKNYNKTPRNITIIPQEYLEKIKGWLTEMKLVYYEAKANFNWNQILKHVNGDLKDFVEGGSWHGVLGEDSEDEDAQSILDGDSSYEESEESDDDDAFDEEDDDDDDGDGSASDSGDDHEDSEAEPDDSDDESGASDWSEQERRLEREDRERRAGKTQKVASKKRGRGDSDDEANSIDSDAVVKKRRR